MTDNELKVFTNYLEKKFHISTDKNSYQQTSRDIVDSILELTSYVRAGQLPSMAGNSGKFLTNNGTTASWGTLVIPPAIDKYLKTDADLSSTLQVVKDAIGGSSKAYLSTVDSKFLGTKVQIGDDVDSTYLRFGLDYFNIYNDGTLTKASGGITNAVAYGNAFRTQQTGENTIPKNLLIGGGLISALPDAANTLEVIGQGVTSATKTGLFKNSILDTVLELLDSQTIIGYSATQKRFKFGFGMAGQEISTRDGELSVGLIDANASAAIRMLTLGTGYTYFDGYTEGATKAQNYPMVLGARGTNTGLGTIGTTTQENGTPIIIGSEIYAASAILNINSTTRGFLTPRMTTAQFVAIASKAQGLEAYSSNDAGKLWYDGSRTVGFRYNGSAFQGYNGITWANMATSLQYWTESYNTYGGQKSSVFTVLGADTHINATIKPKGNGAFTTSDADGTTNGGNLRGSNSVDLQMVRGVAADVASGAWSTLLGGQENRASGALSVVGGGTINRATGLYSSILGGLWCEAYLYNQEARGNGSFGIAGDSQKSSIQLKRKVSGKNAGDNTELFLDGISIVAVPNGNNRAWNVTIETTAVCTAVGSGSGVVGDTYTSTYTVGFKRVGGIVSIVSAATLVSSSADAGMAGASMLITAGAANNLKLEWVAPTSATNTTFRILSAVDLVEVAW